MNKDKIEKLYEDHFSSEKMGKYLERKLIKNKEKTFNMIYNVPLKERDRTIGAIFSSANIRYGDLLEDIINKFLSENDVDIIYGEDKTKNIDMYFISENKLYVGEIKMRDNHDSSKRVGQFENLLEKVKKAHIDYEDMEIVPIMYFIDPFQKKNHNFYRRKFDEEMKSYPYNEYHVLFGDELFELLGMNNEWKKTLRDLEEVNSKYRDNNYLIKKIKKYFQEKDMDKELQKKLLEFIK